MTVQQSLRQQGFREVVDTSAAADRVAPLSRAATLELFKVGHEGINRREFLTYAWAGALALLTLESGLATYRFMSPRFLPGTLGGEFPLGAAANLPSIDIDPQANTVGKFWLVNTEDGPRALYMVCTHLGCLYKWDASNNHFLCPCHASQFSREGHYIKGPAPRSLDQFVVEISDGDSIVAKTEDDNDRIVAPAAEALGTEVIVDTGVRIRGKPAALSPARARD